MKSKKGFDIAAALNAPHFQAQTDSSQIAPDPLIPTRVKITLDSLVPYADNPRVTQNPNYEEIKESIRNRGLDHAPNITRQYPDQPYMIKDGGNTRLAILNDLWQETNDLRFYELDCMFHPWTSDLDVLVGHMVENEARGSMLFIERAIAAVKIKLSIEEQEQTTLSVRELAKRITALGWTVDFSNLGQLLFAHENLFPIIPNTFWNGMGRDGVKKIRKILDHARTFWESVAKPEEGVFEEIWQSAFAALDGDAFELGEAQNQLEANIAQHLDVPFMAVRGEIQAISQGVSPGGVRPSNLIAEAQTQSSVQPSAQSNLHASGEVKPKFPSDVMPLASNNAAIPQLVTESSAPRTGAPVQPQISSAIAASEPTDNTYKRLAAQQTDELMYHCFGLAHEVGMAFGFEALVQTAEGVGFNGFKGFHSGYVLLPEDTVTPLSRDATFYYLYLHQLSCWFVDDHNNPEYWQVSNQVPISFLGDALYWFAVQTMLHRRATVYAAWQQGHELGQFMPLLEELEIAVAIISFRSGLGE